MTPLRTAIDIMTGLPIDRDTPRAATRRAPQAGRKHPRRGILSGHWDRGNVVGAFREDAAALSRTSCEIARRFPAKRQAARWFEVRR
jgi:hypothetical protein